MVLRSLLLFTNGYCRFGRSLPVEQQSFVVLADTVLKQLDSLKSSSEGVGGPVRRWVGGPGGRLCAHLSLCVTTCVCVCDNMCVCVCQHVCVCVCQHVVCANMCVCVCANMCVCDNMCVCGKGYVCKMCKT
jgi:hypothetical protein